MTRKFKSLSKVANQRPSTSEKRGQKRRAAKASRWAARQVCREAELSNFEARFEARPAGKAC